MVSKKRCRPRAGTGVRVVAPSGFTLIELLAVMTIILILAGLILSIAGNANYKAAQSRAQGEIQAISTACESYKTDNGAYPELSTTTDVLKPASVPPPDPGASGSPNAYQAAGETLYQALAGVSTSGTSTDVNGNTLKSYMAFTPSQLGSGGSALPTPPVSQSIMAATYLVDPFGLPYGYSTANAAAIQAANASGSPAPSPAPGYNPTFDLWSTGGYSASGGKPYPTTGAAATPANYNTLWVKNW